MNKPITEFEIINHGVEHEQYFQGCGVSYTIYTDVATGIGDNLFKAVNDALDNLAMNKWDIDSNKELTTIVANLEEENKGVDYVGDVDGVYYYASVRVK